MRVKVGDIFWCDDVKPLDGGSPKRRPIIVVDTDLGEEVVVVCCSTSSAHRETDAVRIPDRSTQPQCKTGLTRPCHAIPRWFFPIHRDKLTPDNYSGKLTANPLKQVLAAYLARLLQETDDE